MALALPSDRRRSPSQPLPKPQVRKLLDAPFNEVKRGRPTRAASSPKPGDYSVQTSGKGLPNLVCYLCRESFPVQSNLAIAEELLRISNYLEPQVPSCPNEGCELQGRLEAEHSRRHTRFGIGLCRRAGEAAINNLLSGS